jgi:SAM-dependent methyltransferase
MTMAIELPVTAHGARIAYEPELIPPVELMREEGIDVIEEWFRWSEEWSMLLRIYGRITRSSSVLEIGCGLGRVAFPLRYLLAASGSYDGFEICEKKVRFLQGSFQRAYPNFRFTWADIHNTYYNPNGAIAPAAYPFPYASNSFDIVFAASVFTHMLPDAVGHYFAEAARVLRPGGRCVFSFFLLDNYRPGQPRPLGFARSIFNFDHCLAPYGDDFATVEPDNLDQMTAYRLDMIRRFAGKVGLELDQPPLPGLWSGSSETWVGAQDVVILQKTG